MGRSANGPGAAPQGRSRGGGGWWCWASAGAGLGGGRWDLLAGVQSWGRWVLGAGAGAGLGGGRSAMLAGRGALLVVVWCQGKGAGMVGGVLVGAVDAGKGLECAGAARGATKSLLASVWGGKPKVPSRRVRNQQREPCVVVLRATCRTSFLPPGPSCSALRDCHAVLCCVPCR